MKKEKKEAIYNLVLDYLIIQPETQNDLFGDPLIITVTGVPIDVTIYHQYGQSIVCYSEKTFFGFSKPISNRWNAVKILSQWLFKGLSPKTVTVTWQEINKTFTDV